jgi:peptide/nickel transport system substrate-binding protein
VTNWGVDRVSFEAFREGWRPPRADKLEILALEETASRLQALLLGQIDIGLSLLPDSKRAVEQAGGKLMATAIPSAWGMPFITTLPGPQTDVRVRRALNHAVDKKAIIDTLLNGESTIVSQPATQGTKGYQKDIAPYAYDPARAKQLLTEAGHGGGFKILADVTVQSGLGDIYQRVAHDTARVGVDIELREIPIQEFTRRLLKQAPWQGTMLAIDSGSSPSIDAMRTINSLHSCKFFNAWYCDQSIMPPIDAANQEFDPAKREQLVAQVMRHYHDQAPAIFLHEIRQYDGVSAKVRNYEPVNMVINYHAIDLAN